MDIKDNLNDYEKLIDALGREIASLYELCGAIKEIVQQAKEHSKTYKQFGTFFYMFYRLAIMKSITVLAGS